MNKKKEGAEIEKRGFDFWLKENKELVLRLLVVFLSFAIFFFWLSNLKNVWRSLPETADSQNWKELKVIINEPLGSKSASPSSDPALITGSENSEDGRQEEVLPGEKNKEENIDNPLKELLDDAVRKAENSQIEANCPSWINCMPSLDGQQRACQIPPGCEDMTQIAY